MNSTVNFILRAINVSSLWKEDRAVMFQIIFIFSIVFYEFITALTIYLQYCSFMNYMSSKSHRNRIIYSNFFFKIWIVKYLPNNFLCLVLCLHDLLCLCDFICEMSAALKKLSYLATPASAPTKPTTGLSFQCFNFKCHGIDLHQVSSFTCFFFPI